MPDDDMRSVAAATTASSTVTSSGRTKKERRGVEGPPVAGTVSSNTGSGDAPQGSIALMPPGPSNSLSLGDGAGTAPRLVTTSISTATHGFGSAHQKYDLILVLRVGPWCFAELDGERT